MRRRCAGMLVVALLVLAGCSGCSGGNGGTPAPNPSPSVDLPALARSKGVALGVGANELRMDRSDYQQLIVDNFTSISPQNAFKWERTEPSRGRMDYSEPDPMMAFAREHGLRVRACCLAWHNQNPRWLTQGTFTNAEVKDILRNHITAEMTHYKGQIAQWDVVNEIFYSLPGGRIAPRNDVWYKAMGIGYVAQALRWARAADPSAQLFINEYGIEGPGPHFDALYKLVRTLKRDGVPLDGVGLQMHRGFGNPTPAQVRSSMEAFGALGVRVEITEMDLAVPLTGRQKVPDDATLARQGLVFRQMTGTCLRVKACTGVTVWGVDDRDRYQPLVRQNRGGATLFTVDDVAKPAYYGVVAAFTQAARLPGRPSPGGPPE